MPRMARTPRPGTRRLAAGYPPAEWISLAKAVIETKKLSYRELGRMADVSAPTILRMLQGRAALGTVERVAKALGLAPPLVVPPSELSLARLYEKLRQLPPEDQEKVAVLIDFYTRILALGSGTHR